MFHLLLQEMWSAKKGSTNPQQLKYILSNKSDMYSGFQQQDAQEFLSILLDTLHEDLNQGDLKKTFVMPDGDGKCDEEVSEQSWNFHKQRNDSYFVKNFMGQYKSKVSCLECGKVSITFDPYMYLSLPLAKDKISVDYCFLSLSSASIGRCKIYTHLPINVKVLLEKISLEIDIAPDRLSMFTVSKSSILSVYKSDDLITKAELDKGQLIIQENKNSSNGTTTIKVVYALSEPFIKNTCSSCGSSGDLKRCLRCRKVKYCNQECQKKHFQIHKADCKATPQTVGIPLVLYIKNKDLKYDKMHKVIASSNIYLNFVQEKEMKLKSELKIGNNEGMVSDTFALNVNSKPTDIVKLANEGFAFVLILENTKNFHGVKDFEINDTESLQYRQPKISLGDCFEAFTQEECLPDTELWKCPSCNKLQKATKQISLYSCPNYLIVHLKRFQAKNIIMFDKIDKHVTFPVNNLDLSDFSVKRDAVNPSNYVYDLYGVSNHYGSLYRGHYTAYSRLSGASSTWREFDDRSVNDIDENSVQSQAAYVLFYKRRDFSESISRGILSSEDEEEFFDASSGGAHNEVSDHSDDNSCYFEAKVSDDDISTKANSISISNSSNEKKIDSDQVENMECDETGSQKTTEGSSSSDTSCDYVKVENSEIHNEKRVEIDTNCANDKEITSHVTLDAIEINFEDELD